MQAAESWDFPSAREERRGFVQRRDQRHSILILERKNKNWALEQECKEEEDKNR